MDLSLLYSIREALILYMVFMASMCLRASSQALVADKLGDPLPRLQGRVTLNPFAHMDSLGSFFLPLSSLLFPIFFGGGRVPLFGWSKPIELGLINPETRVRDEIFVALTGPSFHLITCLLIAIIGGYAARINSSFIDLCAIIIQINATLAIFNLLPLPPFDGGTLLRYAIRMNDEVFEMITRYSFFIFILLLSIPLTRQWIMQAIIWVSSLFYKLLLISANII